MPSGGNKATPDGGAPKEETHFPQFNFKFYEPHTEIIFLPALKKYTKQPILYGKEEEAWFRPTTIEQLVDLKHSYPSAKIVAGSSEVQGEVKFKQDKYTVLVYVGDIEGLKGYSIEEVKAEIIIGGNTSVMERHAWRGTTNWERGHLCLRLLGSS